MIGTLCFFSYSINHLTAPAVTSNKLLGGRRGCSPHKRDVAVSSSYRLSVSLCSCFFCVCVHLGGDDEERGLWVELSQSLGHVSPVDVGHKPNFRSTG